jgi:ubiquinone/menaquinone biosynthesis C-methylase UbiE
MQIASSRDQFNLLAERYSQSPVHRAGASLPVLLELAEPKISDLVLDVATGPGNTAFALADSVQSDRNRHCSTHARTGPIAG